MVINNSKKSTDVRDFLEKKTDFFYFESGRFKQKFVLSSLEWSRLSRLVVETYCYQWKIHDLISHFLFSFKMSVGLKTRFKNMVIK